MSRIRISHLQSSLPRPVVGCGIQGPDCLAACVTGQPGGWFVHWAKVGALGDPGFARELSEAVGGTPLWTPPGEDMAAQMSVTALIDTGGENDDTKLHARDRLIALQTQIRSRLEKVIADASVICGGEVKAPDGDKRVLVGAGARAERIKEDYRNWRRRMGIVNPHIASPAAAVANLYLTLHASVLPTALRLVVVEGRITTHAILMDGWVFVDSMEYRMLENQIVDEGLIAQWADFLARQHALPMTPQALVVSLDETANPPFECWFPLDSGGVRMAADAEPLLRQNPDLAAMAFGMALQGGR